MSDYDYSSKDFDQNSVLANHDKKIIYLPSYLRIKLKNFVSMDLKNLDIELNIAIIFTVKYGDANNGSQIDAKLIEVFQKEGVEFLFQKNDGMKVVEIDDLEKNLQVTFKNDKIKKEIKYTVRRKLNAKVYPQVKWTPFELIYSVISITVQSLKSQEYKFQFNLMDHPNNFLKLSYDTADAFGNYSLAWNLMRSNYTNERINQVGQFYKDKHSQKESNTGKIPLWKRIQKKVVNIFRGSKSYEQILTEEKEQEQKKIKYIEQLRNKPFCTEIEETFIEKYLEKKENEKEKNPRLKHEFKPFKFANFLIPIYKFPSVQLLTIFLPLALLSLINLGVFFQDFDLHDRIATISILMIAFVALIPTLRQELPPATSLLVIQGLVYLQSYTCLIALLHSMNIMDTQQVLKMHYLATNKDAILNHNVEIESYDLDIGNTQFVFALAITIFINFIMIVLTFAHKLIWEPNYNVKPLQIEKDEQFVAESWSHPDCKKEIDKMQNATKLTPLPKNDKTGITTLFKKDKKS